MKVLLDISVRELAKLLGISPAMVQKVTKSGKIGVQIGVRIGVRTGVHVNDAIVLNDNNLSIRQVYDMVYEQVYKQVYTKEQEERLIKKNLIESSPHPSKINIKEINKEEKEGLFKSNRTTFSCSSSLCADSDKGVEAGGDAKKLEKTGGTEDREHIDYNAFIEAWNTQIAGGHIPKLSSIQGRRREQMRARVNEYGKASLWTACTNLKKSIFFKEHTRIANFDWMIRPNNFPKVLEGNYNYKE